MTLFSPSLGTMPPSRVPIAALNTITFAVDCFVRCANRTPFVRSVAFHSPSSTLRVAGVPNQVGQNDKKERTYCNNVHKNTNKQSDTSNE
ncbi:hypothetical protein [Ruegeria sp. Ofav3-42]|uniref:hypothetical protein n=1 Tax=Ruegeria sp. Ofav3-42 TaxID=2917759 RepID=UPI001EF4A3E7|nr:hypothetical protein [Ruegeria sp. Ofav3-42]MCG7518579.1 hypothetical protein [Ruegeria sp. Ofav3-42]